MDPLVTAAIGAAVPVLGIIAGAAWKARGLKLLGGDVARAEYITTLEGLNKALTAENASLRTDLAGCESENRRWRRDSV